MKRTIWKKIKNLILVSQTKLVEAHSSFNWKAGIMDKATPEQLGVINEKADELTVVINAGIKDLQDAIDAIDAETEVDEVPEG